MKKLLIFTFFLFNLIGLKAEKLEIKDFEEAGKLHNQNLELFLNNCINDPNYVNSDLNSYYEKLNTTIYNGFEKPNIDVKSLLSGDLSQNPKIKNSIDNLHNILDNVTNISQLEASINSQIELVKSDLTLTDFEYNSIMSMYYVAKYSGDFWASSEFGGSGKGLSLIVKLNDIYPNKVFIPSEKIYIDWKHILEKDAWGAVWGALYWCGVGACTGVGSAAGFVGGMAYGAVTSSLVGVNIEPFCRSFQQGQNCEWCCLHKYLLPLPCCPIDNSKN